LDAVCWHSVFFLLFALAACGFAVAVVVSTNVVRMAFSLVLSLGAVAGLFFLAGADLVGVIQLLVYVGGTMVLLVFGVMLTARGTAAKMKTTPGQWLLALVVGGSLLTVLWQAAFSVDAWRIGSDELLENQAARPTAAPIGLALLGVRVDQPPSEGKGQKVLSGYLLAFEIVSVHLLVVLVGAAYLARARRRAGAAASPHSAADGRSPTAGKPAG
jgi:NADH-quinone oxidoreductase subunit J